MAKRTPHGRSAVAHTDTGRCSHRTVFPLDEREKGGDSPELGNSRDEVALMKRVVIRSAAMTLVLLLVFVG